MDTTIETQRIISICTGLRGLERGLEQTGMQFREVCFVEIEAFIIANLVAAMEEGVLGQTPIWSDVKTFNPWPFRGLVHGITGGYSCQPFSNAGKRRGKEDPRHIFPYILNAVNIIRPVWCFFENVPGHLTLGYDEVYRSLSDLGYSVESGIFSAREVGATSVRKRLFILAIRSDVIGSGDERFGGWSRRVWGWDAASRIGMVDTESGRSGRLQNEIGERQGYGIAGASGIPEGYESQLANTEHDGCNGSENREGSRQGDHGDKEGKIPTEQPERCGSESIGHHEELGDTNSQGLQGSELSGAYSTAGGGLQCESEPYPTVSKPSRASWPAALGLPQHEWERPRTIKPSLVYNADGYNFREDLIRAIGNSVVEQTAELAFITLSRKHYESIEKE